MFQDTGGVAALHPGPGQTNNEITLTEFNGSFEPLLSLGNITALNMSALGISSLAGFPTLPHLEKVRPFYHFFLTF